MQANLKAIRAVIVAELPVRTRWYCGDTPVDYDFTIAHEGLYPLNELAAGVDRPDLVVFGLYDYAEGGGARPWLCIRKTDGAVLGFAEEDPWEFDLNSTAERFIQTFLYLDGLLTKENALVPTEGLDHLRTLDPLTFPCSEWKKLVEGVGTSP
jgi:hypothetical protein